MNDFVRALMNRVDPAKKGELTFDEMWKGLQDFGVKCTYSDAFTLLRRFDTKCDGKVEMRVLFEGIKKFINTGRL